MAAQSALSRIGERYFEKDTMAPFFFKKEFKKFGCDIVFAPGGTALSGFHPIVTMCRNMLPFESREIFRYGFSLKVLKLFTLRFAQIRSFKSAQGIIFIRLRKNQMNSFY